MKYLFVMLLFINTAYADIINFTGSACDSSRICYTVATDTPTVTVSLYNTINYPPTIVVNGIAYHGTTVNKYNDVFQEVVTDALGQTGILNVSYKTSIRYVSSGRAHYYLRSWAIVGGSLEYTP